MGNTSREMAREAERIVIDPNVMFDVEALSRKMRNLPHAARECDRGLGICSPFFVNAWNGCRRGEPIPGVLVEER